MNNFFGYARKCISGHWLRADAPPTETWTSRLKDVYEMGKFFLLTETTDKNIWKKIAATH